jgi:pimeloyl-ACP methyl ester carboxylesterase
MNLPLAQTCRQGAVADADQFSFDDSGIGSLPIVLLHGLFGSPRNWQPVMQELAAHYRFLALQLPIEPGRNRHYKSFESLSQLTDHVLRFLDALQLDRVVLCGNSLGGQIAIDLGVRYPERVSRLVLSGSAGLFERNLAGGGAPRLCRNYLRERICEIFHDPAHATDELVDDVLAMLSDRQYRRFLLKVAKATRNRYMIADLPRIRVPTLIVWGRDDSITPPFVADQFGQHIPNAEVVFLDQCGHSPPIEQPLEFARHLHAFLRGLSAAPGSAIGKPR